MHLLSRASDSVPLVPHGSGSGTRRLRTLEGVCPCSLASVLPGVRAPRSPPCSRPASVAMGPGCVCVSRSRRPLTCKPGRPRGHAGPSWPPASPGCWPVRAEGGLRNGKPRCNRTGGPSEEVEVTAQMADKGGRAPSAAPVSACPSRPSVRRCQLAPRAPWTSRKWSGQLAARRGPVAGPLARLL